MNTLAKIGIWFACILAASGTIVAVGGAGKLGAIPAALLEVAAFALAGILCKTVDNARTKADRTCETEPSLPSMACSNHESCTEPEIKPRAKRAPVAVIVLSCLCLVLTVACGYLFYESQNAQHSEAVAVKILNAVEQSAFTETRGAVIEQFADRADLSGQMREQFIAEETNRWILTHIRDVASQIGVDEADCRHLQQELNKVRGYN